MKHPLAEIRRRVDRANQGNGRAHLLANFLQQANDTNAHPHDSSFVKKQIAEQRTN